MFWRHWQQAAIVGHGDDPDPKTPVDANQATPARHISHCTHPQTSQGLHDRTAPVRHQPPLRSHEGVSVSSGPRTISHGVTVTSPSMLTELDRCRKGSSVKPADDHSDHVSSRPVSGHVLISGSRLKHQPSHPRVRPGSGVALRAGLGEGHGGSAAVDRSGRLRFGTSYADGACPKALFGKAAVV